MARLIPIFVLLVYLLGACSGSQEATAPSRPPDIENPFAEYLTSEELDSVAVLIRELERNPIGEDADEQRFILYDWLTWSPDIHMYPCDAMMAPFFETETLYKDDIFSQFLLSGAAYQIENPGADSVDVYIDAMEGALVSYRAILAQEGDRARDPFMDIVAQMSRAGIMRNYVTPRACDPSRRPPS